MSTTQTTEIPLPQAPTPGSDVIGTATAARGGHTTFRQGEKLSVDETTFYPCTLSDLIADRKPNTFKNDGTMRDVCVWCFTLDGHEDAGVIARETSFSLSERSNFPGMCKGVGGAIPQDGQPIKKSDFVGKKVKCLFELVEKGDRTYVNVAKVVPA